MILVGCRTALGGTPRLALDAGRRADDNCLRLPARGRRTQSVGFLLGSRCGTFAKLATAPGGYRALLNGVHEFVAEQRVRSLAVQAAGEVNITPEGNGGGTMILGHAIAAVDLHAAEVGAQLRSEMPCLAVVEWRVGLGVSGLDQRLLAHSATGAIHRL